MVTNNEALSALQEAETTGLRSRQAYGYSLSAPYCFIWGVVWLVGYTGQATGTRYFGWIWCAAVFVGAVASILLGRYQAKRGARSIHRVWLLLVVIYAFSFALFAVFSPLKPLQIAAYWPLLWAGIYCGIGLWLGMRYVVVGVILGVLTLVSLFYFRDQFYATMAIAGGGALILTGFWLRRA